MKQNKRNSSRVGLIAAALVMMMTINMELVVKSTAISLPKPFSKFHVKITNQLTGDNKVLELHCRSHDNDLGECSLAGGTTFQFHFRINFASTTLFWCDFWYDNRHHHAVFNVFDAGAKFIDKQCRNHWCNWESRDDGFYLFDARTKSFQLTHKWDEKHV